MNFYEQLMKRLFGNHFEKLCFNNTTCLAQIDFGLRAKLQLEAADSLCSDYSGIRLRVIDRRNAVIDEEYFDFTRIISPEHNKNQKISIKDDIVHPYWSGYEPTEKDLDLIGEKITEYISFYAFKRSRVIPMT